MAKVENAQSHFWWQELQIEILQAQQGNIYCGHHLQIEIKEGNVAKREVNKNHRKEKMRKTARTIMKWSMWRSNSTLSQAKHALILMLQLAATAKVTPFFAWRKEKDIKCTQNLLWEWSFVLAISITCAFKHWLTLV